MRHSGNSMIRLRTKTYNYNFDRDTGFFMRWGESLEDNPRYSPVGPELADIEVSTVCSGLLGTPCPWCYKTNTPHGANMSLEKFTRVVRNINPYGNLLQVALGVGDIDANPDLVNMLRWCRESGVVPNITVSGARLDSTFEGKTYYQHLADYCGAVAVSHYDDDLCFDAVKRFTDLGVRQVNIHEILAEETIDECFSLLNKVRVDKRLEKLNAVVFLLFKPKGDRNNLTPLKSTEKYKQLVKFAIDSGISIGSDSCGAVKKKNI